ncbi:hypothetical protein NX774_18420 [Massilia agilis]|uniref:Uncharacterized protein n=1 Tax=Massilia agilis TaxID=1811226 RepID=A0ABT2DF66_9BURK|nr:hypothetical protein [Massilia agilis]MCS0809902.1 hypothetical protein [Massilia agilis]
MNFKLPTMKDLAKLVETCDKYRDGAKLVVAIIIAIGIAAALARGVSIHLRLSGSDSSSRPDGRPINCIHKQAQQLTVVSLPLRLSQKIAARPDALNIV